MLKRCLVLRRNNVTCLFGDIYGDERFPDGHWILTSTITSACGPNVYISESGTVYTVEREITMREFFQILMDEKFETEGLKYCLRVAQILQSCSDPNHDLDAFIKRLREMAEYDEEDW